MMQNDTNEHIKIQMLHELETWQRTLNYLQQENIHLKNRLAEIVKNGIDDKMLRQAEYFQNQFLNKDVIIAILKQDVLAERDSNRRTVAPGAYEKLREDMAKMETAFAFLKSEFNGYVSKALS